MIVQVAQAWLPIPLTKKVRQCEASITHSRERQIDRQKGGLSPTFARLFRGHCPEVGKAVPRERWPYASLHRTGDPESGYGGPGGRNDAGTDRRMPPDKVQDLFFRDPRGIPPDGHLHQIGVRCSVERRGCRAKGCRPISLDKHYENKPNGSNK